VNSKISNIKIQGAERPASAFWCLFRENHKSL